MTIYGRGEAKNVTVDRALRVLEAFHGRQGALSLADLSRELNLDKSVIHRILATLVRRRFLEQDPVSKNYQVGLRMWELGQAYISASPLEERAASVLAEVVAPHPYATGYFSTLDRDQAVVIRTVRGPGPINIYIDPGARLPASNTATGRSMLAFLPPEELEELFPQLMKQRKDHTGETDRSILEDELKRIVDAGYAVNKGGFFPGIGTVARSIRDARGRSMAALSVDFPMTPETESLWHDLPKELGEAADDLEALVRALPDSPDL